MVWRLERYARFPRSRGDEPPVESGEIDAAAFSPLTRG